MIPILIGLRAALVVMCTSVLIGLVAQWRGASSTKRWRLAAWGCFAFTTGAIWTPLAFLNATDARFLAAPGTLLGDSMRLVGALGYICAFQCASINRARVQGLSWRRSLTAVGFNLAMVGGFVLVAILTVKR